MADTNDEIFSSVLGDSSGAQAQSKPAQGGTAVMSNDEIFDSVVGSQTEQSAPNKVQGAGTPDNPFSAVITFSHKLQEARQVGQAGFREAALGHAVMDGRLDYEEAQKQIEADDSLAQMSGDLDQYQKNSAVPWLTGITLETAKQLPMLEESLKVTAGGAAVGAGAAAATGAGAPFAVPVGLMTGSAATAGWAMDFISGQEYMEMRQRGLSHDVAKVAAPISGFVQGMLQGVRFGEVGKVATNAARNTIAAHAKSIANFFAEGLKFGATQELVAEAQTATRLITQAIAGTVSNVPGAIPTVEEAVNEFLKTFMTTLQSSIGLFAGGKVTGKATGMALKPLVKKAVDVHLKNQKAKLQKIEEQLAAEAEEENGQTDQSENTKKSGGKSKNALERERLAKERKAKRDAAEAEVKRIFEAANSKYFIEHKETRLQETNRIQRLLKRMVANSDKLDDAMKAKLFARIVEIDGVADLLREGERFIEEQKTAEERNALDKANERLEKVIKRGQPKDNKAILPQAAQASLQWYDEFFTPPKPEKRAKGSPKRQPGELEAEIRAKALQRATDYVEKGFAEERANLEKQMQQLENGELSELFNEPTSQLEKRRIAMNAQMYWSGALSAEDIHAIADSIEQTVKDGKSEFQARKEAETARLLKGRAEIQSGVNGIKPVVPSESAKPPKQISGFGKILHSLRRNASALWDKLLQDMPAAERKTLINKYLDFTETENKESAINIAAAEKLSDLYIEAVGSQREANRLLRDGANPKQRVAIEYTNAEGVPVKEHHTINELTYLSMAFEDEGALPGLLHGNKYTLEGMIEGGTSTQEAVNAILETHEGGKYLKLAGAVKDFYRWFAPQIANHYLREYGVKLPMHENYSGQIFHRHLETFRDAADLLESVHDFANQTLNPGSTKLRKNSKLPIKLVDPFDQVQRHQTQMAFWIANSEKARLLSFIFSDTSKDGLRDVIEHKLGAEYNQLVDSRIAFQYHLKPGIMDIADRVYAGVKGRMATGFLGARIDQAPKQWLGVLHALSTCNYGEFLDGLKGAADKKRLQEYLKNSDLYKDRQNHILPQILEATKERTFTDAVTGDRALAIKQFLLIPMHKWGDGVGAAVAGFIEYNRALKAGASVKEAALAGDRLVDTTQSSSRISQRVPAEFKGGIANLMLSFAKEGIQAMNRESGAYRDLAIHKDADHLARAARVFVSIHVAQALFQAINSVPAYLIGDDKQKEGAGQRIAGAALFGSYATIPLIGVDLAFGIMSGWQGHGEPRTIIGGLTVDLTKGLKRFGKIAVKIANNEDIDGEDWVKSFDSLASVASVVTGLPFWGAWSYTKLGSKLVQKAAGGE